MLAIDPTSPFSGGAILGDRVRMQDHATDPERVHPLDGHPRPPRRPGPRRARRPSACWTPSGKPWIIVETVGVGQVEVEIAGQADTTVVVVNPGWGDAVQANKAGLMEIADVFVINKADRAGVDRDPAGPRADARPVRPGGAGGRPSSPRWPPTAPGSTEVWERGRGPPRVHREERPAASSAATSADRRGAAPDRRPAPGGPGPGAVRGHDLRRAGARPCSSARLDPWAAADVLLEASAPERASSFRRGTRRRSVGAWLTSWCTWSGATTGWPWSPSTTRRSTPCPASCARS